MDDLASVTMKSAVKCDNPCELQTETHQVLERMTSRSNSGYFSLRDSLFFINLARFFFAD
jgi:hypothetical protein